MLKIGSVVSLKSGGALMTVSDIAANGSVVWCVWHDFRGVPQSGSFLPAMLEEALEPSTEITEVDLAETDPDMVRVGPKEIN